jgi:DNA-binding NtrC family response regulator
MAERRDCILIIEDDPHLRRQIARFFADQYDVLEADGPDAAVGQLGGREVDLVLVDMHLPPDTDTIASGLRAMRAVREAAPDSVILAMSGDPDRATCLKAAEAGAYDFFTKPIDTRELQIIVRRALERRRMDRDLVRLQQELEKRYDFSSLMGVSSQMEEVKAAIRRVADSNATILIRGESGTGKELVARAIHFNSSRRKEPFVPVNCSALPEHLVEDELFGHEKGAFTGADRRREGRFEMAHRGTLFLDEIATISAPIQAKLLRVLETREFERLGGKETVQVDIRLVAATNQDLERDVAERRFRQDLYYRVNVVRLDLPPLRERRGDISLLASHFLACSCSQNGTRPKRLAPETLARLEAYGWPGNVRELLHLMESLSLMVEGPSVDAAHLPPQIVRASKVIPPPLPTPLIEQEGILWQGQVESFERSLLEQALRITHGKKSAAAQRLGLKRDQMKYLCRKYGL